MAIPTLVLLLIGALQSHADPWSPRQPLARHPFQQEITRSADGQRCVALSSGGRLKYGRSFVAQLPGELELRLRPEGDFGWTITVGRPGGTLDYMWVASPPFQDAPHRQIGPVYGLTARESVSFTRQLRFVLTDADYNAALKIVRDEVASSLKRTKLERLGRGQLTITIERFALRPTIRQPPFHEAIDWIECKGEGCITG